MKKRTNYLVLLIFIVSNFYAYSNSSYTSDGNEDTIFLKNGETIRGDIYKFSSNSFKVENETGKIRIKNSEVSYVVIGQELSAMEKMSLGELDGKRYAKRAGGNVILGFFTGLIGSGIVYLTSNQTPSFEAMAGPNKAIVTDPMYVNGYIKGAKNKSTQNALIGTIGWVVLLLL